MSLSSSTLRMSVAEGISFEFGTTASTGLTIDGSGSTRYAISTPGVAANTGASCLPRTRRPMTATRTFSFGLSAARLYEAAESVSADAARNSRRVAGIGSAPGEEEARKQVPDMVPCLCPFGTRNLGDAMRYTPLLLVLLCGTVRAEDRKDI